MAVRVDLKTQDIEVILKDYNIGQLQAFAAIETRIANTVCHLRTDKGNFILALYDEDPLQDLPYMLKLKDFLGKQGVFCAKPCPDKQGNLIKNIKNKCAAISNYLPGNRIQLATAEQVKNIAHTLGQLHTKGASFTEKRPNQWDQSWRSESIEPLLDLLAIPDALLLQEELGYCSRQAFEALPKGTIHGNLTLDCLLFEDKQVVGIIDFYYACFDTLLLDVATTVNNVCHDGEGQLDQLTADLFLATYQEHRELTALEHRAWPAMRQVAAFHHWLLHLVQYHHPRKTLLTHPGNPEDYRDILLQLRNYNNIITACE